ncbi:hypothetical protein SteCoe_29072 [Stentor coeruleus]|uniref:Uncharacterized protein n=1 Tax=Stentor coeruleus TaxID=5963 RepID=A0A1R2B6S5_9CILI|nr:hypothetical protein SteCoe_29072 [Stentor coeruleus]
MGEKIILYGSDISQPTRSVRIFCELSNIPYALNEINFLAGENFRPEFTKINPNQEVPAITHGDYHLWESSAIVIYLANAFNIDNNWYPKDIKIRGRIDAYLIWHNVNIRPPISIYYRRKYVFPKFYGKPELNPQQESELMKEVSKSLSSIEWILKENSFIARTLSITIADVFLYSELATALIFLKNYDQYPHLKAWFNIVSQVPEVKKANSFILNSLKINPKI